MIRFISKCSYVGPTNARILDKELNKAEVEMHINDRSYEYCYTTTNCTVVADGM